MRPASTLVLWVAALLLRAALQSGLPTMARLPSPAWGQDSLRSGPRSMAIRRSGHSTNAESTTKREDFG